MKIFIYKSIFVAIIVFILFQITFGFMIRNYENKLYNSLSKEMVNLEMILLPKVKETEYKSKEIFSTRYLL